LIDSRNQERLPTKGWALEASVKFAGRPIGSFFFQRYTMIDRRYFTWKTLTFSSRITLDSVGNDAPFWELTGVGGYDPILDINGSHILKGVDSGRYHEYHKILGNFELRWPLKSRRVIGLLIEPILVPMGVDLGRMGSQSAYSMNTGFYAFFNKGILARMYACFGEPGFAFTFGFGTDL